MAAPDPRGGNMFGTKETDSYTRNRVIMVAKIAGLATLGLTVGGCATDKLDVEWRIAERNLHLTLEKEIAKAKQEAIAQAERLDKLERILLSEVNGDGTQEDEPRGKQ